MELQNKTMITVPLVACLVTGLVLLSPISTFSDISSKQFAHTDKSAYSGIQNTIMAKLSLQLEKANMYVEEKLGIRHTGWIAGPVTPAP